MPSYLNAHVSLLHGDVCDKGWPSAAAAGKTGTSDDYRDAWFAGYTPAMSCVVWVVRIPLALSHPRPAWYDRAWGSGFRGSVLCARVTFFGGGVYLNRFLLSFPGCVLTQKRANGVTRLQYPMEQGAGGERHS